VDLCSEEPSRYHKREGYAQKPPLPVTTPGFMDRYAARLPPECEKPAPCRIDVPEALRRPVSGLGRLPSAQSLRGDSMAVMRSRLDAQRREREAQRGTQSRPVTTDARCNPRRAPRLTRSFSSLGDLSPFHRAGSLFAHGDYSPYRSKDRDVKGVDGGGRDGEGKKERKERKKRPQRESMSKVRVRSQSAMGGRRMPVQTPRYPRLRCSSSIGRTRRPGPPSTYTSGLSPRDAITLSRAASAGAERVRPFRCRVDQRRPTMSRHNTEVESPPCASGDDVVIPSPVSDTEHSTAVPEGGSVEVVLGDGIVDVSKPVSLPRFVIQAKRVKWGQRARPTSKTRVHSKVGDQVPLRGVQQVIPTLSDTVSSVETTVDRGSAGRQRYRHGQRCKTANACPRQRSLSAGAARSSTSRPLRTRRPSSKGREGRKVGTRPDDPSHCSTLMGVPMGISLPDTVPVVDALSGEVIPPEGVALRPLDSHTDQLPGATGVLLAEVSHSHREALPPVSPSASESPLDAGSPLATCLLEAVPASDPTTPDVTPLSVEQKDPGEKRRPSPVVSNVRLAIKSVGLGMSFLEKLRQKRSGMMGRLSLTTTATLKRVATGDGIDDVSSDSESESESESDRLSTCAEALVVPCAHIDSAMSQISIMTDANGDSVGDILPNGMRIHGYARLPDFTDETEWVSVTVLKLDRVTGMLVVRPDYPDETQARAPAEVIGALCPPMVNEYGSASPSFTGLRSIHVSQFVRQDATLRSSRGITLEQVLALDGVPQAPLDGPCGKRGAVGINHTISALDGRDLVQEEVVKGVYQNDKLGRSLLGDQDPHSAARASLVEESRLHADASWLLSRQKGIVRRVTASLSPELLQEVESLTSSLFQSVGTGTVQRQIPLSKTVWHCSDACQERIGESVFQRRGRLLEEGLLFLDQSTWPHMHRFKAMMEQLRQLVILMTPASVMMNPEAIREIISDARSHYLGVDGDYADFKGIPEYLPAARPHCSIGEFAEHNRSIALAFATLLEDVVRNKIHWSAGDASWADLDSTLDVQIEQFKRRQMIAMVGVSQRAPGEVLTLQVDVDKLKEKAFIYMKERRERLFNMLDFMVLSMLHSAAEGFAAAWHNDQASLESQYLTKPIWRAGLRHSLMDVTQPCEEWDSRREGEMLFWPHLPGSRIVEGSEYPRGSIMSLPLMVIPKDSGSGFTMGKVPGFPDPDSSNFSMYEHVLSQWKRTRSVTSLSPRASSVMRNGFSLTDVVDPMEYQATRDLSIRHQMGLSNGMSRRLAQRLAVSDEELFGLTGYPTFEALIAGISVDSVEDSEVYSPPKGLGALCGIDTFMASTPTGGDIQGDPELSPLNSTLVDKDWDVIAEFSEFVAKIPLRVFYLNSVTESSTGIAALKSHLEQSRAALRDRHSQILRTALDATLHCMRQIWFQTRQAVVLPEHYHAKEDLVQKVQDAAPRWVAASESLEDFADTMLSHGTYISVESHIALIRIARFASSVVSMTNRVSFVNKKNHASQLRQLLALASWQNDISQTVSDTCKRVLQLSAGIQDQLCDAKEIERFSFLSTPFEYPSTHIFQDMVMGYESCFSLPLEECRTDFSLTNDKGEPVWEESDVNAFLASTGLIIAYTSVTGLPALPKLDQYSSVTQLVTRVAEETGSQEPVSLYHRPSSLGDTNLERVLEETIHLIERSRTGIRQIKLWSDLCQVQGIVLSPSMTNLEGDIFLLHKCMRLIRRALTGEQMLQSSPVDDLDMDSISALMVDIDRCLQFMHISFDNKDGVHNMTFATELEAVRDRMQPGVELMRLVTVPSLMHRHLDILESSSSLPVLQMASVSIYDLLEAGALDKLDVIQEVVDLAEEEARVESNLDAISKVMESWKVQVDVTPGINGGFTLPPHFETSIRSMTLYVQRDVAAKYCTPITARARQLEGNILWAKLHASLLEYTQDYLAIGEKLMIRHKKYSHLYAHACAKWWQLRRSVANVARTRLLSVLLDTSLGDILSSILVNLVPYVTSLLKRKMCHILHSTNHMVQSTPGISNGILKHIHSMPDLLGYAFEPKVLPISHPVVKVSSLQGERMVLGPHMLYGIDAFLVRPLGGVEGETSTESVCTGHVEDSSGDNSSSSSERPPLPPGNAPGKTSSPKCSSHSNWEITAVVSGILYQGPMAERTEVLRLSHSVPLSRMVGVIAYDVRPHIQKAVERDMERGVALLSKQELTEFSGLCFQVRYMSLNYWVHFRLRRGLMRHDSVLGLTTAVTDLQELARLLLSTVSEPSPADVHLQTLVLKWIDDTVPQTQDTVTSNINLPVLSAPCITRHQFAVEGQFTVSATGVELKHHSLDWLGGPTAYEIPEPGSDEGSTCSFSLKTIVTLLARGVTCALCTRVEADVHSVMGPILEVGRIMGQTIKTLAATSYRSVAALAHQVSNLLLDGFIVVLTGLENTSPEHLRVVHTIASTLYNGGEFPFASPAQPDGSIAPYVCCKNNDFGCTRTPLGKDQQHPDEHALGSLVLHLAVLGPGQFSIDSKKYPGDPIRYTDARPPPQAFLYHPSSVARPCVSLMAMLRKLRLSILPADVDMALRLCQSGDPNSVALYKYLSVQCQANQLDGLSGMIESAFVVQDLPEVKWGASHQCLTGEGVYAMDWLMAMGERHNTLTVVTRHPLSLVHSFRESVSSKDATVVYLSHPMLLNENQCLSGDVSVIQNTSGYLDLISEGGQAVERDNGSVAMDDDDTEGFGPRKRTGETTPSCPVGVTYVLVNMAFDPDGSATGAVHLQQRVAGLLNKDGGRVVTVLLATQRITHSALQGPSIQFRKDMIRQSQWYPKTIETITGVCPNTTATDPTVFFVGAVSRFCQMFIHLTDRNYLESEGSAVTALLFWLMSESGFAEILPVDGEVDCSPDSDGYQRFSVASPKALDPSVFGLPNVGSGVRIQLKSEYLAACGGAEVDRLVNLFVCAFCVTYNAFSIVSTVQDEFSSDMFDEAVEMTTVDSALEQLKAVHPEFKGLPEGYLADILTSVAPERFETIRFDSDALELIIEPLREPIDTNDWYSTHPRWMLTPQLTNCNVCCCHLVAAAFTFGVHMIVNSHMASGKTWLLSCAQFLLPSFLSYIREEGIGRPGVPEEYVATLNCVTLSPDGNLIPLFDHVLALCVDIHSSDPGDLASHPLYTSIVSGVVAVPGKGKAIPLRARPVGVSAVPHLAVEQGDELCLTAEFAKSTNISLICETHFPSDQLEAYAPFAFVLNAGVLVDDELISYCCECLPMAKTMKSLFQPYLLPWLKYQCQIANVSPLHLLQCMLRQGLVSTKEDTRMYHTNPVNILTAVGRLTGRIATSAMTNEIEERFPEMLTDLSDALPLSDRVLVDYNTAPNSPDSWSNVLIGLSGGTAASPARSFYTGCDSFSPVPNKEYPMQGILRGLAGMSPVAVPSLLQVCMEVECWHAVNNTAALLEESDGDYNLSDCLKCLRVPVSYLCMSGQDTTDMQTLRHMLFRTLHCTVNLPALASVGYTKVWSRQRQKARRKWSRLDGDGISTAKDETESCVSSRSRQTAVSLARSGRSGVSSAKTGTEAVLDGATGVTFFGDAFEKYLPRLVIDMSVLIDGLGVSESHESPIQMAITSIMKMSTFETRCIALVRLAVVLSCGLPPQLVLPRDLETTHTGCTIPALAAPYKVFSGGDVTTSISTRFTPSKTLFSKVLLHIPQPFLDRCPALERVVHALNVGAFPPVFSSRESGQIIMVLGEKYSLPQPDASVLTMKLAQHLIVVVTGDTLERKYSGITSGVTPSPVQWLAAHVPSTTQFLDQRYGQSSASDIPAGLFKATVSMAIQLHDVAIELYPARTYMFAQLMEFSVKASDFVWRRTLDERGKLLEVLKSLSRYERHLATVSEGSVIEASLAARIEEIRKAIGQFQLPDPNNPEEAKTLALRGPSIAGLQLLTEEMYDHPEIGVFGYVISRVQAVSGLDSQDKSHSLNSFLASQASTPYYFIYPQKVRRFLYMYLGLLPSCDTAMMTFTRGVFVISCYPHSVLMVNHEKAVDIVLCLEMWRAGLLSSLSINRTSEHNAETIKMVSGMRLL
ncbi:hypothetical protein KIPB_001556, partial [Kipferlia bialata]